MTCPNASYRCPRCVSRGVVAEYRSEPKCGFLEDGTFTDDNWMCATLLAMREASSEGRGRGEYATAWGSRACNESAALLFVEGAPLEQETWVLLRWYKDRGRTSSALEWSDSDKPPSVMTLKTAEAVLERVCQ